MEGWNGFSNTHLTYDASSIHGRGGNRIQYTSLCLWSDSMYGLLV